MASLALSVVGTAIAGPIGGAIGGMVGGMIDNLLFPAPKPPLPTITASTYGNAIPLAYGPLNRLGVNMVWSSGYKRESKGAGKLHLGKSTGKAAKNGTVYDADFAMVVAAGPLKPGWLQKVWANGTIIFDATVAHTRPTPDSNGVVVWDLSNKSHQMFDTITVYPGNDLQLPNPTMEASLGSGNCPAYKGTAYIVITNLQLTAFGNGIPVINVLVQAQPSITVGEICMDIVKRSGIDTNRASCSSLTSDVQGYVIASQTDGVSGIQPLALVYNFDVAEVTGSLRFVPRGSDPICCFTNDQMAGYAYGDQQPDAYQWPREPESTLPKMAALTFNDPSRDCNVNTQAAQRSTGSRQSNLSVTVPITLSSSVAAKVCDRMLWEPRIARQELTTSTTDRQIYLEAARTYAVETPAGFESVRITKRTRGVNGVIEIEGKRDFTSLYFSSAPGANAAAASNVLRIGGPVNPPFFIEPPSDFPGITQPTILIAVSGGDGTTFNPSWNGCSVYVSTDDIESDYVLIGVVGSAATMGKLTQNIASYGGSNPDAVHTLTVSTLESGGSPPTISTLDASDGLVPYYVGGEFMSIQTSIDLGSFQYQLTNLWRGLYGSSASAHSSGDTFIRIDDSVLRFPLPAEYVGRTTYFRFVSSGETLAGAMPYTHAPSGSGYGGGVGGVPTTMGAPGVSVGSVFANISWTPNPGSDNVTSYTVYRAPGLAQPFSASSAIATIAADTYTDTAVVSGDPYTWFTKANNAIGSSAASPGTDDTIP